MTWEVGSTDQQRLRAGSAVLAFGVVILLSAWGLSILRGTEGAGEAAIQSRKLDPPDPTQVLPAVSAGMLLYGIFLIIILFVSLLALYRLSRNYRNHLFRKPSPPTSSVDVWKMHQLPDDTGDDELPEVQPGGDDS